jgi:hypothetical protein
MSVGDDKGAGGRGGSGYGGTRCWGLMLLAIKFWYVRAFDPDGWA